MQTVEQMDYTGSDTSVATSVVVVVAEEVGVVAAEASVEDHNKVVVVVDHIVVHNILGLCLQKLVAVVLVGLKSSCPWNSCSIFSFCLCLSGI